MPKEHVKNGTRSEKHKEIKTALLIIDVQNDFVSGSLKIEQGEEIVPIINSLLCTHFDNVIYSLDWHPPNHMSFQQIGAEEHSMSMNGEGQGDSQSNVNGDALNESSQKWPEHCVENTFGAKLHSDLKVPGALMLKKGTRLDTDSYSAFRDNNKIHLTELKAYLSERNVTDVYVCGLAYDFCVGATALDSLEFGYRTFVIDDACRGVSASSVDDMRRKLVSKGVKIVQSSQCYDQ